MEPKEFLGVKLPEQETAFTDEPNWQSQLLPNEIGEDDGVKFVYLKGLVRLANIKGIKSERFPILNTIMWNTSKKGTVPFVQASYEVTFKDGQTYSDCADAHYFNVPDEKFAIFPSCLAANRAKSRALRRALGIDLVAKEELGGGKNAVYDMTGTARPEQISGIRAMMKKAKISDMNMILTQCTDREIYSLEELTFTEAQKAMKFLNTKVNSNE